MVINKIYYFIFIIYLFDINDAKKYIFSVIISIYNTGRYLDESINSIIYQSIGFSKIQIILVNDGSSDNSEQICLKYQKNYSENIIYLKINHRGVSYARNIGLKYARGTYINFLDSDDKWDLNAFKYILLFFKFYKNIYVIGGRIKYFEASNRYHFLDYKFKKTRVVDLNQEYNCIQLHASSSFFKRISILRNKFDEGVIYGEDAKFITNIILLKPVIGLVRESIYYYRKRSDSSSAMQNTENNINFYFSTVNSVQQYMINKSKEIYNEILPFIQYYLAYEIIFRISSQSYKYLDFDNYYKYCYLIKNLLKQIHDKYFLEQKIFSTRLQILALSKKNEKDIRYDFVLKNESLIYSNHTIFNLKGNRNLIIWRYLEIKKNTLHLEGEDRAWFPKEYYYYYCQLGNKTFFPKYHYYPNYDFLTIYGPIIKGRIVSFDIPFNFLNKPQTLNFYISYLDNNIEFFPSLGQQIHLPPIINSYYVTENVIIYYNRNLNLYKYDMNLVNFLELNYCKTLKFLNKGYLIKLREKFIRKKNIKRMKKNQIWLINDRLDQARDNGEYFFRYLSKIKPKGIKFYFIIEYNSSDYKRLKKHHFNIINFNSSEYFNLFLKSDKIISSTYESWVYNPFDVDGKFMWDLYHFDFIFIPSGIIKDDLSKYINRFTKKFDFIITSSKKEYHSLLDFNYGYNRNNLALTGLPRFDNLKRFQPIIKIQKIILIIPTWRIYIKGVNDLINHKNIESESFKNSNYFRFFNNFINNETLLLIMKTNDYKGILCLHHNFAAQWKYFNQNEIFMVKKNCPIQKMLLKSSLLITDYSSIFFDFVYIKKPIIYIHFDYEEYRKNHYPQGYFNYDIDGFGPVCYKIECVIKNIMKAIDNNCQLNNFYLKRTQKFFRYFDDQNNNRTFYSIFNGINENNNKNFFLYKYFFLFFIFLLFLIKCVNIFKYI